MKMIKTVCSLMLVLMLAFSFTGCSVGKIISKLTDGNVKVDKDGKVIIKGESGDEEIVIGTSKWDKSKMHDFDAPKAKIVSSVVTEDGAMYSFSDLKENDAKDYIENIKNSGFIYSSVVIADYSYIGTTKEGLTISFMYDKDSGAGTVISTKGEPPSEDDLNNQGVIDGTNKIWDSSEVGGLPDPNVKVMAFTSSGEFSSYTLEKIDDPKDYIEKIKAAGYTEDDNLAEAEGYIMFTANNSAGDQVSFVSTEDGSVISYTKS